MQGADDGHITLSPKEEAFLLRRAGRREKEGLPPVTEDGETFVRATVETSVQSEWDRARREAGKAG